MSEKVHKILLCRTVGKYTFLHEIIRSNGVLSLRKKEEDFFIVLARTVVSQQLSNAAAAAIWNRLESLADSEKTEIQNLFCANNNDALRNCGLSRNKVKAIAGLASAITQDAISPSKLAVMSEADLMDAIKELWGFGQWSAEMTALFYFGKPDVWSDNDVALKRAITTVANYDKTTISVILNISRPYRSYLSLHLWHGIDTKKL